MLDPATWYGCVDAIEDDEVAIGEEGVKDQSNDPANSMLRVEI